MLNSLCIVTRYVAIAGKGNSDISRLISNLEKCQVQIVILYQEQPKTGGGQKFSNLLEIEFPIGSNAPNALGDKLFWLNPTVEQQIDADFILWLDLPQLFELFGGKTFDTSLCERLEVLLRSQTQLVIINSFFLGGRKSQWLQLLKLFPLFAQRVHQSKINTLLLENFGELIIQLRVAGKNPLEGLFKKLKSIPRNRLISTARISVYVISFNAPKQLDSLLKSMESFCPDFLTAHSKILVNNSTDPSTIELYDRICKSYGFQQIKKNNIGISGGRQFVAEHFEKGPNDFYICFEDDMLLHEPSMNHCRSGLPTFIPDLYFRSLKIMMTKEFDFLKTCFTEVFSDHSYQWAWYTVSDSQRKKYFKESPLLKLGLEPPRTILDHIEKLNELSFAVGEIYYSNWPTWTSRDGNRKLFLEDIEEQPSEEKWMTSVFVKERRREILAAVLLASPINHKRIHSYHLRERREG